MRTHAVGQAGGDEAACRHAHIVVECTQIDADQGVLQRAQDTYFIDGTQRATACQSQSDARFALPISGLRHELNVWVGPTGQADFLAVLRLAAGFFAGAVAFFAGTAAFFAAGLPAADNV